MFKIVHLLPCDKVGGVEVSAKNFLNLNSQIYKFNILYLFKSNKKINSLFFFNPFFYYFLFMELKNNKPDVLIVSLWKSIIIGIIYKLLNPNKIVIFFNHSSSNSNFFDKIISNIGLNLFDYIFVDSISAFKTRFVFYRKNNYFLINLIDNSKFDLYLSSAKKNNRNLNFIFWGRLAKEKRIDLAIKLFKDISCNFNSIKFYIIGPDDGELLKLFKLIDKYELNQKIIFKGPLLFSEISKLALDASFYVQLSEIEGAAISVIEAIKLGLIPVVTPVGEIQNYCIHKYNSIIYYNHEQAVKDLSGIIKSHNLLNIRNNISNFEYSFGESIISALDNILIKNG